MEPTQGATVVDETPAVQDTADQDTDQSDLMELVDQLREQVHARFPEQSARREQFDSHLDTVSMTVEHLVDEEQR